jgi:hypothetical protein
LFVGATHSVLHPYLLERAKGARRIDATPASRPTGARRRRPPHPPRQWSAWSPRNASLCSVLGKISRYAANLDRIFMEPFPFEGATGDGGQSAGAAERATARTCISVDIPRATGREGRRGFSRHPPSNLPQALCLLGPGYRRRLVFCLRGIISCGMKIKQRRIRSLAPSFFLGVGVKAGLKLKYGKQRPPATATSS